MDRPRRVMLAWGVALSGACDPGAQDRDRYREVVADKHVDVATGMERCGRIHDPALAGDCGLHVATVALRQGVDPTCDAVRGAVWSHECWFLAAEGARRRGRLPLAARRCRRAGPFVEDCAQHLWQSEVRDLIFDTGAEGFAGALPAAVQIHQRWAGLLGESSGFTDRFWPRFYQNGFEGTGMVDLSQCAGLPDGHDARCVEAGVEVFARDLAPRLDRAGVDLCALRPGGVGELTSWVPGVADPRLDRVIINRVQAVCGPSGQ